MQRELARVIQEIFPSIHPDTARAYLDALAKYGPVQSDLFATQLPVEPCQGDIVEPVTFVVQDDDGEFGEFTSSAMLLSHSCDLDQGDRVVFAACRPAEIYRRHRSLSDIRNNTFFSLFFLRGVPNVGDTVVDFSTLQSVSRALVRRQLQSGGLHRVSSFTEYGYYYLIAKMTVHFLRPRAADERRNAAGPGFYTRLRDAISELGALGRFVLVGRGK